MHIEFQNVSVRFDRLPVLRDISFQVQRRETVLLTGVTGAGKTTLLQLIYRAVRPSAGKIRIDSIDLDQLSQRQLMQLRRQMGIAFQDVRLLPDWTVEENLLFVLWKRGLTEGEMRRRLLEVLSQLQLSHIRDCFPAQLSGGEQQLVGLARALVVQPQLLLADEPTAHLDLVAMQRLINVLRQTAETTTMIIATHHPEMIAAFPNAPIFHLDQGRLRRVQAQVMEDS